MTGYLVGYLLPIILVDPSDSSDVIAVAAFVIILSIAYAAADLHYLNPLLPLVGLGVWQLTVDAGDRRHKFMAIGPRSGITFKTRLSVVGNGPVRLVRV